MEGYIKLFRTMQEWEWYSDPITKAVFLDLLLNANYKDSRFKGVEVKRGQVVFGRKECAERLGISERNVRTAINHLKSTSEVTIKVTNRFSVVTIENYEKYQGEVSEVTSKVTSKVTSNRPASDQQLTTSKKVRREEEKEIKNYLRENREKLDNGGAFHGAVQREPELLSEEESTRLLQTAHEQFKAIKASIMKGATA